MTIDYNRILDNCGQRKEADIEKVKEYILKYRKNIKTILVDRHVAFVESFIENNFDIVKMSKGSQYSTGELKAIFLRIESQFELYIQDLNTIIRQPKILNKVSSKKVESKKVKSNISNNQVIKVERIFANPNTGNKEWDEIILTGLEEANKVANLENILPPSMYTTVMELNEGLTMQEIAKKRKGSLKYLISTLIGRKKGRNKREIGLIRLLKEY